MVRMVNLLAPPHYDLGLAAMAHERRSCSYVVTRVVFPPPLFFFCLFPTSAAYRPPEPELYLVFVREYAVHTSINCSFSTRGA